MLKRKEIESLGWKCIGNPFSPVGRFDLDGEDLRYVIHEKHDELSLENVYFLDRSIYNKNFFTLTLTTHTENSTKHRQKFEGVLNKVSDLDLIMNLTGVNKENNQ